MIRLTMSLHASLAFVDMALKSEEASVTLPHYENIRNAFPVLAQLVTVLFTLGKNTPL